LPHKNWFLDFDEPITFATRSGVSPQGQFSEPVGVFFGGLKAEGYLSNYGLGDGPRLSGVWFGVYFRRSAYMAPMLFSLFFTGFCSS
jgi:hypothetical protein